MNAVFTDGSLAGSLWGDPSSVQLYGCVWAGASRGEEKALPVPAGWWQDLPVTPGAGWDDVSADPHPERPGLCFFWWFLKGWLLFPLPCRDAYVAAVLAQLLFHFGALVQRAVCVAQPWGAVCGNSLTAEILSGLYEQGARKGRMRSILPLSIWLENTRGHLLHLCFVLGKLGFEITLFLTALCLVADCCNCKV